MIAKTAWNASAELRWWEIFIWTVNSIVVVVVSNVCTKLKFGIDQTLNWSCRKSNQGNISTEQGKTQLFLTTRSFSRYLDFPFIPHRNLRDLRVTSSMDSNQGPNFWLHLSNARTNRAHNLFMYSHISGCKKVQHLETSSHGRQIFSINHWSGCVKVLQILKISMECGLAYSQWNISYIEL